VPVVLVMHGSMVLLALRMGCYALLPRAPSPWAVLPVELLHGEEGPGSVRVRACALQSSIASPCHPAPNLAPCR
jgi:hypothetical protein